jgi:hypothetical protein
MANIFAQILATFLAKPLGMVDFGSKPNSRPDTPQKME